MLPRISASPRALGEKCCFGPGGHPLGLPARKGHPFYSGSMGKPVGSTPTASSEDAGDLLALPDEIRAEPFEAVALEVGTLFGSDSTL